MTTTPRSLRAGALAAAALVCASTSLHAAALQGTIYEGFEYSAGAMTNTLNGGTGWNATGDSSANTTNWGVGTSLTIAGQGATVQASGLSYSGMPAGAGGSTTVSGATASSSIGRQFGQSIDTGTLYFSYLTQRVNNEFRTVNFSLFGTNERLAIGQIAANTNTRDQDGNWLSGVGANSGNFAALISNSQNNTAAANTAGPAANGVYVNTASPVAYSSTSTSLLIGKIEFGFNGGVEDRLTLYVNPTGLANEGTLIPYLVVDHNDFGALTGFRVFSGASAGGFNASGATFDEIRFGSTFASVTGAIPEPSAAAVLAGLGGLAFAARRRRRA